MFETTTFLERPQGPGSKIYFVGVSYFAGALVPVLPVFGGATTLLLPVLMAGTLIIIVSVVLAFLSGMNIKRRVITNIIIITAAVAITFAIGSITKLIWGVSV